MKLHSLEDPANFLGIYIIFFESDACISLEQEETLHNRTSGMEVSRQITLMASDLRLTSGSHKLEKLNIKIKCSTWSVFQIFHFWSDHGFLYHIFKQLKKQQVIFSFFDFGYSHRLMRKKLRKDFFEAKTDSKNWFIFLMLRSDYTISAR